MPRVWRDTRTLEQLAAVQRGSHRIALMTARQCAHPRNRAFWLNQAAGHRLALMTYLRHIKESSPAVGIPTPKWEYGDTVTAWLEHFNVSVTCTVTKRVRERDGWHYVVTLGNGVCEYVPERDIDFVTAHN